MGIVASSMANEDTASPGWLIRWGTSGHAPKPQHGELNKREALVRQSNRLNQLALLREGKVRIPEYFPKLRLGDTKPFAILGRKLMMNGHKTTRGRGITLYRAGVGVSQSHDYFVKLIEKARQFRVHVIGKYVRVREVVPTNQESRKKVVWNLGNGFTYRVLSEDPPEGIKDQAKLAIKALGLDFGAVDTILATDGTPYVLEVNTAPSLFDPTLEWYAKYLGLSVGMDLDAMPGWAGVSR